MAKCDIRCSLAKAAKYYIVLAIYLVIGGLIFMELEGRDDIVSMDEALDILLSKLKTMDTCNLTRVHLEYILRRSSEGHNEICEKHVRWDFGGSVYYAGTLISTVGESICAVCHSVTIVTQKWQTASFIGNYSGLMRTWW